MARRITRTFLETQVENLNNITGAAQEQYIRGADGKITGYNTGVFMISGAYGGYSLHRSSGPGVSDVFNCGHISASYLADLIAAYTAGYRAAKGV